MRHVAECGASPGFLRLRDETALERVVCAIEALLLLSVGNPIDRCKAIVVTAAIGRR